MVRIVMLCNTNVLQCGQVLTYRAQPPLFILLLTIVEPSQHRGDPLKLNQFVDAQGSAITLDVQKADAGKFL